MIHEIFQQENKYYKFYIVLPVFLWLELLIGVFLLPEDSFIKGFFIFSGVICITTSIVLELTYYRTQVNFQKQFELLTREQKNSITECGVAKGWKVYLTKDILIQYGMFTKRIILIKDVESIQRNKGIRVMRAGMYGTSEEVDEMLLTMKNGSGVIVDASDEIMKAMNALLADEPVNQTSSESINCIGEKPIEGITALALLGSIVLFMGGYSYVMRLFTPTENITERVLFSLGYESYFWLGAMILMGICMVSTFVWRAFAQRGKNIR